MIKAMNGWKIFGAIILVALAVWIYLVGNNGVQNEIIDDTKIVPTTNGDNATSTMPIVNISTSTTTATSTERLISYTPESAAGTIVITSPKANTKIKSPVKISGQVKGWFFEASFPIVIVDWDGRIIGEGIASSIGDWMSAEFVPFEAEISFTKPLDAGPQSERGAIILKKDNPSGLSKHDASAEVPIIFE